MKIAKIDLVYFSPTGSTKRVMERIGKKWTEDYEAGVREYDLTSQTAGQIKVEFSDTELVFIGVPSFGGRVPELAMKRIRNMKGNKTPAVLLVTYGNRDYDDTLLELQEVTRAQGFIPFAAIAAIAEHSIFPSIAKGRPDDKDRKEIWKYAKKIIKSLQKMETLDEDIRLELPGKEPFREYKGLPFRPMPGKKCTKCGICIKECPTGAIAKSNPSNVDENLCISCMRCVYICPQHARKVKGIVYEMGKKKLRKACAEEKKNELFLPQ